MRLTLVLLSALWLAGCQKSDGDPSGNLNFDYPATFALGAYEVGTEEYFLVGNNQALSPTDASVPMAAQMEFFQQSLWPDFFDNRWLLRALELEEEGIGNITIYNTGQDTSYVFNGNTSWESDERLTFEGLVQGNNLSITLDYEAGMQRFHHCLVSAFHSTVDPFSGQNTYSAFHTDLDIAACGDPSSEIAGIWEAFPALAAGDTLGLTRHTLFYPLQ